MNDARRSPHRPVAIAPSPMRWLTRIAFVTAVVVMIARLTTPDALRDPADVLPGSQPAHAGLGAGTGLVLDLFAILPALLVLARSAFDKDFRLRSHWSHLPLFTLALWAVLSTAWASDRFAAAVGASHFFAAACLLWAMAQLVGCAGRFRLVAAVCFGLLLVLLVQSVMFKFVDVPQNIKYWNDNKTEILKEHNWAPDSFEARQFEMKVTHGELLAFFKSANSVAAVALLLFTTCIGIGIQKLVDRENRGWIALPLIAAIALIYVLFAARSKTSIATPFLGFGAICLFWLLKDQLRKRHRTVYLAGVGLVALGLAAVIGHGLYHHGLFPGHFSSSLDFRWKYWVASIGMFATHPWAGVGWDNFGLHYLAHRLPEATEGIKDPHNFLVHFFVELGVVGGLLSIAWLLRLAWELITPASDAVTIAANDGPITVRSAAMIVIAGSMLAMLLTTDLSLGFIDLLAVSMKPLLLLLVMLFGTLGASMLSTRSWLPDTRPAPWIYYGTVSGFALFLIHNLIDFSWFEPGAMFLFMALIGTAQGMSATAERRLVLPCAAAVTGGAVLAIGWLTAMLGFVVPVIAAEQYAASANESIRTASTNQPADYVAHFQQAADDLQSASQMVPYNSDYIYRRARILISLGNKAQAKKLLDETKHINPQQPDAWLLDAGLQLSGQNPDRSAVQTDFQTALKLSPNDVTTHIEFAKALDRFGMRDQARKQYELALAADAALPVGEPNRLSPEQVEKLQAEIKAHGENRDPR